MFKSFLVILALFKCLHVIKWHTSEFSDVIKCKHRKQQRTSLYTKDNLLSILQYVSKKSKPLAYNIIFQTNLTVEDLHDNWQAKVPCQRSKFVLQYIYIYIYIYIYKTQVRSSYIIVHFVKDVCTSERTNEHTTCKHTPSLHR